MEKAARAIIAKPILLLPLILLGLVEVIVSCPQLLLIGVGVAVYLGRRRARKHRFDPFVEAMLR